MGAVSMENTWVNLSPSNIPEQNQLEDNRKAELKKDSKIKPVYVSLGWTYFITTERVITYIKGDKFTKEKPKNTGWKVLKVKIKY